MFSPKDMGGDDAFDSDPDPETGMTDCITLMPGITNNTIDAGIHRMAAKIGGFVWNDVNMNGLQDEGEAGLEGIEVSLYTCEGDWVASDTTDADGMYLFEEVDAGEYYLQFVNPFGWIFTFKDEGEDDTIDSDVDRWQKRTDCFTVDWGQDDMTWDAGLFEYDGCTHGKGYWKNHTGFGPQGDEVSILLPIWLGEADGDKSLAVTDPQITYDVLQQHEYDHPSNGITKLYAHLLTAKLNIIAFANPADVSDAIAAADAFLTDHDWNDWEMLSKDDQQQVLQWKGQIESYNEGYTGPGTCDDGDDPDDDHYDD